MNDKKKDKPKTQKTSSKVIARTFNAHWNTRGTGLEIAIPKEIKISAGDEFDCKYRIFKGKKEIIYTEIPMR